MKTSRVPNSVPAGILIKMLKNEKKRAQDAAAQLAYITNSQSPASQNALMLSTLPARDGNTETFSADPGGPAIRYMKRGT